MGYLQPTQYASYGLSADVSDDWITIASAMIDAHCRRTSLNPAQYTERLRLVEGAQTARLSYLPLAPIAPATSPLVNVRARYGTPRRGQSAYPLQEEVAWAFSLPGSWITIDPVSVDFVAETGELVFPLNVMGLPYNEVEVTYTAGLTMIPDAVLSACALIVKNAQATPGLNVKSSKIDKIEIDYFSSSLVDETVRTLLAPWVAARLG